MEKINHLVRKYSQNPLTKLYTYLNNFFAFDDLADYVQNQENLVSLGGFNILYRPLLLVPNLRGQKLFGEGFHGEYVFYDGKYHHDGNVKPGTLNISNQFIEAAGIPPEQVRYDLLLKYWRFIGNLKLVKVHMRSEGEFELDDIVKVMFEMYDPLVDF